MNSNVTPEEGDFLPNSHAVNLAPVTVGRRRVDQLKVLDVIREILHNDEACAPYFESYCNQLEKILHSLALRTNIYDIDSCVVLCDLVEEFLSSLVLCFSSRTHHNIDIQKDTAVDWYFWIRVAQRMLSSENSNTELRALAFLFNVWDHIPIAQSLIPKRTLETSLYLQDTSVSLNFDEQNSLRWNCTMWLLSPQMWKQYFCHWHPLVRSYFLRLLCWRVASVGPNSGLSASNLFIKYNTNVRYMLHQRLEYTFQRFTEVSQISIVLHRPIPSAAPSLPVLHRQLKITYNPASTMKPVHSTFVPMIYNDNGNGLHGSGGNELINNSQRQMSSSPILGQQGPMARVFPSRRIDPYEIFDDFAYLHPSSSQSSNLGSNIDGGSLEKPFAPISYGSSLEPKQSGVLNGTKSPALTTKSSIEPPLRNMAGASSLDRSNSFTSPRGLNIVQASTGSQNSRPLSMPSFPTRNPAARSSPFSGSTSSWSSVKSAAITDGNDLDQADRGMDELPANQSNFKHSSSLRKKWDLFKSGHKSGLGKYFGHLPSNTPLTEGRVAEPAVANGQQLSLYNAHIDTQPICTVLDTGSLDTQTLENSPDSTTSQFYDAIEPPSSMLPSLSELGVDFDVNDNNDLFSDTASDPVTPTLPQTSKALSLSPSVVDDLNSSPSLSLSTSSPFSPDSLIGSSEKSNSTSDSMLNRKMIQNNISQPNQNVGTTTSAMPNQLLPSIPLQNQQHKQLDSPPQLFLSSASGFKIHGPSNNNSNAGFDIKSNIRRGSSYSNVTALNKASNMKNARLHLYGSKSASSSLTHLPLVEDSFTGLKNSNMSQVPTPPQICRKRPEIVRPLYKFSLDSCDESMRRQQEFIQNKRHSRQSGGINSSNHMHPFPPPGPSMYYGYNSNSSSSSLNGSHGNDYYHQHTRGYFVYQQRNQNGYGIGSAGSDCYVTRPKLPFVSDDEDSSDNSQSQTTSQKLLQNQSHQRSLTFISSLNSLSDEECEAHNITGVEIGELMRSTGVLDGAMEIIRVLSETSSASSSDLLFFTSNKANDSRFSLAQSFANRTSLQVEAHNVSGRCIGVSSTSPSSSPTSPTVFVSASGFNRLNDNDICTTTLAIPSDDKSDLSSLSTPTAGSFSPPHSSLSGSSNDGTTVVSSACFHSPTKSHHQTSAQKTNDYVSYGTIPEQTFYSSRALASSETCTSIATTYTARTGLSPKNSRTSLGSGSNSRNPNEHLTVDIPEAFSAPLDSVFAVQPSKPNGLENSRSQSVSVDFDATPTSSADFMSNPFGIYEKRTNIPFESSSTKLASRNTTSSKSNNKVDMSRGTNHNNDGINKSSVSQDFEYTELGNTHTRVLAKLRDNDKYWKYGGRAINEWSLIVREFTDFVHMRKAGPRGIVQLEDLDVPFLIAEIPSKALVG